MTNLPKELQVWNEMSPMDRLSIMQAVGYQKSQTKLFRACLAHIKEMIK